LKKVFFQKIFTGNFRIRLPSIWCEQVKYLRDQNISLFDMTGEEKVAYLNCDGCNRPELRNDLVEFGLDSFSMWMIADEMG
jgi:hypothetical protein